MIVGAEPDMLKDKSRSSKIFQIILFAFSVGLLIYFCISDNNLIVLLQSVPSMNIFWLSGALICVLLGWVFDSLIIKTLIDQAFDTDYGFKHAFKVTMVGQYFNSVTPYAVAGQPMQFLALIRQGITSGIAISALVRKFLVYQTSITCYSLAVIIVKYSFFRSKIQDFMALAFIGFLYQAAIVVILILFTYCPNFTSRLIYGVVWLLNRFKIVKKPEETEKRVKDQLEFYIQNNKAMQGNRKLMLRVYLITFFQLTVMFSVPFFIYKAFRCPGAPIFNMIAAQSFVTMISSYTPLPGAAGAAEGSFLVIFQMFFSSSIIKQAMLLWRLITYYSCIIVGAFFAGFDKKREKLKSVLHAGKKSGRGEKAEDTADTGTIPPKMEE